MIDATIKQDVYNHLKNDTGTFPVGGGRTLLLKPSDSRKLYTMLGLANTTNFHLHVYPYALAAPVEDHLPTIEFVVRPARNNPVLQQMDFRIDFRLLSRDETHVELDDVAGRLFMLMTSGTYPLWNANPPGGRYPRQIETAFDTGNVASLEMPGIIGRMMSFTGGSGPYKNLAGQQTL